jgi:hypothetical protein
LRRIRIRGFVSELKISVRETITTATMKTIQKSQRQPIVWETKLPMMGPTVGPSSGPSV